MKDTIKSSEIHPLISALMQLLMAHRKAFHQERTYRRAMSLLFGELFSFARHTVTQGLLALGISAGDWSAFYRLFSRKRFDEEELTNCLLNETLQHVPANQAYTVGMDGTTIHRSSLKMPGTSWLIDKRFSAFRPGIHRAQRFLHGAWLTPIQEGFSRAIPLRFLPAFPEKAVPSEHPHQREWEAGLRFLQWVRCRLDGAGRSKQLILALADGGFDVLELWRGLPKRVVLVVRTARNRALFHLPEADPQRKRGRPHSYGPPAKKPAEWLHAGLRNWPTHTLTVRGKAIQMRYQVLGPFVRDGLPEVPVFLLVIKGMHRLVGKKKKASKHKGPSFYLVSAVQRKGQWLLPFPVTFLLAWLWQRWEIEVAHREMKSGLGIGEMQCWNTRSAVLSVQWSVWMYAVILLAGYRTWGLLNGPATPARWWRGAQRWSLTTLWRAYRAALWGTAEFRALWSPSRDNWWEIDTWFAALNNAVAAAARI
jgi:hypothetical protein